MRNLLITATVLTFASASMMSAGNLAVLEEPTEEVIAEEPMGGSNASWLIPLLLIGGIAVVVASGNGNGGGANGANGDGPNGLVPLDTE